MTAERFKVRPLAEIKGGQRVVLYGSGGIGKTTLAMAAPKSVFIDLDLGASDIPEAKGLDGVNDWADLLEALRHDALWDGCETIIIDSVTAAERWCKEHVCMFVPNDKGVIVTSIEDYGYGKGYTHVYDEFLKLLAELDRHITKFKRNVILVCHQVKANSPNPFGEDYLCYEPDLQQPGKLGRIRDRVKNWCDHMLFIAYDIGVDKAGKGIGSGTRSIYSSEMPTHWAKTRSLDGKPIPFPKGSTLVWDKLFNKTGGK